LNDLKVLLLPKLEEIIEKSACVVYKELIMFYIKKENLNVFLSILVKTVFKTLSNTQRQITPIMLCQSINQELTFHYDEYLISIKRETKVYSDLYMFEIFMPLVRKLNEIELIIIEKELIKDYDRFRTIEKIKVGDYFNNLIFKLFIDPNILPMVCIPNKIIDIDSSPFYSHGKTYHGGILKKSETQVGKTKLTDIHFKAMNMLNNVEFTINHDVLEFINKIYNDNNQTYIINK
jgi:hypothetical protein